MPKLSNYQKDLKRYRNLTHQYLDGIWKISSKRNQSRNNMYQWLALQMGMTREEAHISKFDISKCRKAISILRFKYIQLYGRDLFIRQEVKKTDMFFTETELNIEKHKFKIVIYCKSKTLTDEDVIENIATPLKSVEEILSNDNLTTALPFRPTLENIAKWLCEKFITAYKVEISQENSYKAIYEELPE